MCIAYVYVCTYVYVLLVHAGANSQKGHNKRNRTTYLTAKVCNDIMAVGIIWNSSEYYVVSNSGISKKLWAFWVKITHF